MRHPESLWRHDCARQQVAFVAVFYGDGRKSEDCLRSDLDAEQRLVEPYKILGTLEVQRGVDRGTRLVSSKYSA
jgi:hypothetical protein